MKLLRFELRKVWAKPTFFICLAFMVGVNLLLLWSGIGVQYREIPPKAWYDLGQDIAGMTIGERQEYISTKNQESIAFAQLRSLLSQRPEAGVPNIADRGALVEEYGKRYTDRDFVLYTGDLSLEFKFLSVIQAEIDAVAAYDNFIQEIQYRAQQLGGISIFNDTNGYDMANIRLTAQAYSGISGVVIEYIPQQGAFTAVNYAYTDLILLFSVLVLAGLLVREERDNGLLILIRSTAGGRAKSAGAKLGALAVSLLAIVIVLYGANLLYCQGTYGLGALSRSVQSLPFLMRCTMQVSVGQYLTLFVVAKWAAALIVGNWVLFAALITKKATTGWILGLLFIGLQWGVRAVIPATSYWNIIKYANLASLLHTNELLGEYRNLYWFGHPVPLLWVESLACCLFATVFLIAFVRCFAGGQLADVQSRPVFNRRKWKATTLWRAESYKALCVNGVAVLVLSACAFQLWQGVKSESLVTPDEMYYRYYMEALSGPYTDDTRTRLQEERQEFEPIFTLENRLRKGEISDQQYAYEIGDYFGLQQKREVFETAVADRINYVRGRYGAEVVYSTGYEILFGLGNVGNMDATLLAGILAALCFSGLFALERQSGFFQILISTPLGRRHTVNKKILWIALLSFWLTFLVWLPRWWQVLRDYGLPGFFAPSVSIPLFAHFPVWLSLGALLIISMAMSYIAFLCLGLLVSLLAHKVGNTWATILIAGLALGLPPLLAILGVDVAKWVGLWPSLNVVSIWMQHGSAAMITIFLACTAVGLFSGLALRRCYALR